MRTILSPAWIVDGAGGAPLSEHAVVIRAGKIESVVPSAALDTREGDRTVPLPGATLVPGLMNNHVHMVLPGDNSPFFDVNVLSDAALSMRALHNAQASLRAGVTTLRDCGARGTVALDVRNALAQGLVEGARVIACGWPITISGGHTRNFGGEADGADGLRVMVRRKISLGADFVKVMASGGGTPGSLPNHPSYTVDELRVIVATAHALGRPVVAHCICTTAIENAVDAGVDFIEHAMFTTPERGVQFDQRVAEKLARAAIPVTPTLQVFRDLVDLLPDTPERESWRVRNEAHREVVGRLRELGVLLLAGSDAGWRATAFETFWKELDEFVRCGLSPVEAIHAASGAIAAAWGYTDFGTIAAGRAADLVVVQGDLAKDIRCLAHVRAVYQAGRLVHTSDGEV